MAIDKNEGPFKTQPKHAPSNSRNGYVREWRLANDGNWYSFAPNIGPGGMFKYQHPDDPNFWSKKPDTDPEDVTRPGGWACRHGWWVGDCTEGCGSRPNVITVTDEEVEEAGKKLAALLSSMESK